MNRLRISVRLLLALLIAFPALAGDAESREAEPAKSEAKAPQDRQAVTRHSIELGSEKIHYTAKAGTLVLKDEEGAAKASFFYVAYTRDGLEEPTDRPLTFAFNGGPGSSSVWLHLGAFGPRRVLMDDEGKALPPPYRLVDNEGSILDVTDLVFIDPVTTGFSRAAPGEDDSQFHGVREDIESVGEFIRLYTTRNGRWASPKFLAGESYGTTRAAGLSGYLQERHGMYLNGVMLVSSVLEFSTLRFEAGNELPYILFLPTYTATAWYHGKLDEELQADLGAALRGAEGLAHGIYSAGLLRGKYHTSEKRHAEIRRQLARYTGLSEEFIERSDLRIRSDRFVKELLREDEVTVGRLDSRFKGRDRDSSGERAEFDPSYAAIRGPYTAMLNHYVRAELEFESDLPYEILTGRVRPWSFKEWENRYVNVAETLRGAITQNPALQVFVASGYYDLATPYFATESTFSRLGLPPELRDNVQIEHYESGHMMYIRKASLIKLKADLAAFISNALGQVEGQP